MKTKFINKFSEEIYTETYKFEGNGQVPADADINESFNRIAKSGASIEKDQEKWTQQFTSILHNFNFVAGGRITSNAGTGLKGTTLVNCFVSGPTGENQDSMQEILNELTRQGMILKSEGGYGFNADFMRPRGCFINGIGVESPGAVKMLEMWDKQSEVITEGSGIKKKVKKGKNKIRKGAMMVTMSCWHPAIEEFITAKQTPGRLTKFNMSVLISDEFMNAVKNNLSWNLEFPDTTHPEYDKVWDGNMWKWKSFNFPVIQYKTFENANELWDLIMKSTYTRNEPGVLFVDTINKMNNLSYCEYISATNPCLAEGTKVNTPNGYVNIEDIKVGDLISTLHVNGFEPVKAIETHQNYPVFKVTFSDGGELLATAAHQFYAVRKGKNHKKTETIQLKDLKIGDSVQVATTKLESKIDFNSLEYKKALLAGLLLGDGSITEKSLESKWLKIASNQKEPEYNEKIKSLLNELGYTNIKEDKDRKSNSVSIVFKINDLQKDELYILKGYSETKNIPQDYLNNSNQISGILNGLISTDGNINLKSNHPQIRITTVSKEMAKSIRLACLNIGIHARISSSFKQDSGTINGRKIIRKNTKYVITLSGDSLNDFICIIKDNCFHPEKNKKIKEMSCRWLLSGGSDRAQIKSIEEAGRANVYDLYCEETDTWITEGYVSRGCGEQLLPREGGSCLLGSINLTQYINKSLTDYDYKKIEKDIPSIVRFMDNINDISNFPLPEQKEQARLKRRIGIGYLGYASSLYLLQVRYGSKKALEMTEKLCNFVTNKCYQASAMLAKEKGCFPLYNEEEFLKSKFVKQALTKETIDLIKKHGLRNSHLTSIQPTGNSSVFANNVSSGLEPIFMSEYIRTVIQSAPPEGMTLPKIDFANRKYDGSNLTWDWVQEGDEYLLATNFNNTVFKIDQNRGLVKEEKVKDYSLYILEEKGIIAKDQDWVVNTSNLNIDEHIDTMKVFAKYIDSAISKTVNLPNDYSFEDFKSLYVKVYDTGYIKGCTTYRAGTMTSVLSAESSMLNKVEEAGGYIKRPKKLDCDINQIKVLGEKWIVLVGLYEGRPYEVFSIKSGKISIPATLSSGKLIKNGSGKYDLECGDGWLLQDIRNLFESDEQDALTRIISTALRNGVKIEYIVEQLYKSEGSVVSFSKAVARTLKKYVSEKINLSCPNCTSKNIVLEEGCFKCKDCGNSKCQ